MVKVQPLIYFLKLKLHESLKQIKSVILIHFNSWKNPNIPLSSWFTLAYAELRTLQLNCLLNFASALLNDIAFLLVLLLLKMCLHWGQENNF